MLVDTATGSCPGAVPHRSVLVTEGLGRRSHRSELPPSYRQCRLGRRDSTQLQMHAHSYMHHTHAYKQHLCVYMGACSTQTCLHTTICTSVHTHIPHQCAHMHMHLCIHADTCVHACTFIYPCEPTVLKEVSSEPCGPAESQGHRWVGSIRPLLTAPPFLEVQNIGWTLPYVRQTAPKS